MRKFEVFSRMVENDIIADYSTGFQLSEEDLEEVKEKWRAGASVEETVLYFTSKYNLITKEEWQDELPD